MFLYALTIILFAALTSAEIIEADRSINKTKKSSAVDSIFLPEQFSPQTKLTDSQAKQILETHIYSLGYTILDNQLVKRNGGSSKEDQRIKNLVDQYRNSTIELFKSKKEKILKKFQEGPANYLEDNQRNHINDFFNYMQFSVLDTQPYYLSSNLTKHKQILKSLGVYHQQLNNYSYSDIKFYSKDYELLLDDNIRDSEMNRDYYSNDDLPTVAEKKDKNSGRMKEIYADNDQSHSKNDKKSSLFMKIYLSNATHLRPDMVTFPSFCVFNHLVVGMILLVFSFIGMRMYHDNHPILLEGNFREFAGEERKFVNVQSNKPKIVADARKNDFQIDQQKQHRIRNETKSHQIPVTAKNSKTNSKISSTASSKKKNKNSNNKFTVEKVDCKTKTLDWLSKHKLSSSKDILKTTQSFSLTKIFDIKNSKESESKNGKEIPLRFTKSLSGTKVSHNYVEDIANYCYEIGPQSLEIPENMSFTELHNSRRTSALSSQKSNTNTATKNNIQLINLVREKQEQTLKENYTIDSSDKIEKNELTECQCSGFDMGDHDYNDGKNNGGGKFLVKTVMRNGKSQNDKTKMPQTTSSCDFLPSNNERDESVKNGPCLADSASKII